MGLFSKLKDMRKKNPDPAPESSEAGSGFNDASAVGQSEGRSHGAKTSATESQAT